jgi:F-type H+-transporting ATPase subunit alpha
MLKQAQNAPIPVEEQVCVIYTGINGYLDDVAVDDVIGFLAKFRTFLKSSTPQLLSTIKSEQKLSPESEESLKKAIADAKAM